MGPIPTRPTPSSFPCFPFRRLRWDNGPPLAKTANLPHSTPDDGLSTAFSVRCICAGRFERIGYIITPKHLRHRSSSHLPLQARPLAQHTTDDIVKYQLPNAHLSSVFPFWTGPSRVRSQSRESWNHYKLRCLRIRLALRDQSHSGRRTPWAISSRFASPRLLIL